MNIPPEIRFLYYYHLKLRNRLHDQEVKDLVQELVSEGHWPDTSVAAVIKRLKEDKSDEVG